MSDILNEIKSNTCPYCGAPYTIADGGCRAKCPQMTRVHEMIAEACEEDEQRDPSEGER